MPHPSAPCLMIMARYPTPGQAKTRLIPALGAEGAAQVYRQLAERMVAQAKPLQADGIRVALWYTGAEGAEMQQWLGRDLTYCPQPGGDLGDRLIVAFQWAFSQGHRQVIVVGTDCPDVTTDLLRQGFDRLKTDPLLLGPACDGGYYLIGLTQPQPTLFQNIAWSTATVLAETVAAATTLGLVPAYLPTLTDIDRPEDLAAWERFGLNISV